MTTKTHEIKLDGYGAHTTLAEDRPIMLLGTAESYGIEKLHVVSGKSWDGLTVTATFNAPDGTSTDILMDTDGNVVVPSEATAKSGSGRIVFTGVSNGIQRISCDLDYFVVAHSAINGAQSGGTAPSWFEQAATRFMPAGGTAGQVLTKVTDTDFNAEWQDSKGGADGKSAYSYAVDGGYTGTEAEFAAKLAAEKLPNPYPLTFTGAVSETYDGSSAKTIEIPSSLPTGGTPYQQLVTDGTGKATWEDRTHWVEQSVAELIPEQTLSGGMSMGSSYMFNVSYFTIIPNLEYTVVFDGVEYKCISAELEGLTYIGNATLLGVPVEDTGEPFFIAPLEGMSVITATDGPHTIALSGWSIVYHQLLLDYIPNGKFLNGFIEHSSLTMTRDEASRYGRILSMSLFPMLVWQNFRIKSISIGTSNGVNEIYIEDYDGALYTITENSDGLYSVDDANNGHNYLDIGKGNPSKSRLLLEGGKPVSIEGIQQSTGNALDYTTFCVKKTGRQNGQDFEVLGNGTVKAYSVILPSSTKGSTKQFKLTVDDSGTISATEVV